MADDPVTRLVEAAKKSLGTYVCWLHRNGVDLTTTREEAADRKNMLEAIAALEQAGPVHCPCCECEESCHHWNGSPEKCHGIVRAR